MDIEAFTGDDFANIFNVSRETMDKLKIYIRLLEKWNKRINLVGRSTLSDPWKHHIIDSAQLKLLAPNKSPWIDLGSGAGFPGLVCAILGAADVHLVESDRRKCSFLREAARVTDTDVTIHNCRVEELDVTTAAIISARALANLNKLLSMTVLFANERTIFLFPKGLHVDEELTEAAKCWKMNTVKIKSKSDKRGTILKLQGVVYVGRP